MKCNKSKRTLCNVVCILNIKFNIIEIYETEYNVNKDCEFQFERLSPPLYNIEINIRTRIVGGH